MSGFDRALGALSRREMLECARGLLKVLAGEAGEASALASGGAAGIDGDVARAGGRRGLAGAEAGASGGGAFGLAAAGRAGRDVRQARGGERARREGVSGGLEGAENVTERGGALDGPERRGRSVSLGARERESVERGDVSGGSGAAFAGPERRYDDAAGARGMEMSRVSDYFRRDSRRYDAGYTRF